MVKKRHLLGLAERLVREREIELRANKALVSSIIGSSLVQSEGDLLVETEVIQDPDDPSCLRVFVSASQGASRWGVTASLAGTTFLIDRDTLEPR